MFAPHAFPNMHAPCSSTGSKKNAFLFVCVLHCFGKDNATKESHEEYESEE